MSRGRILLLTIVVIALIIVGFVLLSNAIRDEPTTTTLQPHATPFGSLPTITPNSSLPVVTPHPTDTVQNFTPPVDTAAAEYCVLYSEPSVWGLQLGHRHPNPTSPQWRTTCCEQGFVSLVNGQPLVRQANITTTVDIAIDSVFDPTLCQK